MNRQVALCAALAAMTSCVPAPSTRMVVRQDVPPVSPRQLLAALDLKVAPSDTGGAVRATPAVAPAFSLAAASADDAARAAECLTAAVYYEARSEPVDGQRAVAQVVLNRVRDRAFPKSVCGVVYQGSTRSTGCQFSFTCDGSMDRPREWRAWDRARTIAEAALSGAVFAPVGSATFFHTHAVSPWWAPSMAAIGSFGSHIFYRWRGTLERALAFRQRYSGVEPGVPARPGLTLAASMDVAGQVEDHGVTVHRGRIEPVAANAPDAPRPRALVTSGVRIHVGTMPMLDAAGDGPPAT
jgi:hypothetical protein